MIRDKEAERIAAQLLEEGPPEGDNRMSMERTRDTCGCGAQRELDLDPTLTPTGALTYIAGDPSPARHSVHGFLLRACRSCAAVYFPSFEALDRINNAPRCGASAPVGEDRCFLRPRHEGDHQAAWSGWRNSEKGEREPDSNPMHGIGYGRGDDTAAARKGGSRT